MNKNPLNKGVLTENAIGIGTMTPEMVEARARKLAVIAGRVPRQPPQVDYEQANPNQNAGTPCQVRLDATRRIRLAKTRIAKDEARVRSLSKKESKKRSTIRCSKQRPVLRQKTDAEAVAVWRNEGDPN